jgi:hypothetical protein
LAHIIGSYLALFLPNTETEKLGGESTGQRGMEVENQEGQGPLWAVAIDDDDDLVLL